MKFKEVKTKDGGFAEKIGVALDTSESSPDATEEYLVHVIRKGRTIMESRVTAGNPISALIAASEGCDGGESQKQEAPDYRLSFGGRLSIQLESEGYIEVGKAVMNGAGGDGEGVIYRHGSQMNWLQKQKSGEGRSCKTCTHDLCEWTGQDVTEPCEYYYKPAREQEREEPHSTIFHGDETDGIELRYDHTGDLDEVVLYVGGECVFHSERMDNHWFWMGVYAKNHTARLTCGPDGDYPNIHMTAEVEEDNNFPGMVWVDKERLEEYINVTRIGSWVDTNQETWTLVQWLDHLQRKERGER